MTIADYQVTSKLFESATSIVYRAQRMVDHQPVVLKVLKDPDSSPERIAWFKREYDMTRSLCFEGVVLVYALVQNQERWVMVLEDFGGDSLTVLGIAGQLSIAEFLELTISVTDILGRIHQEQVIHKDVNPSNILLNQQSTQLKLIDFGISSKFPREITTFGNTTDLEGTLAYIAPEQTGRMNHCIDYRSDFYSLGVTFYELLTGQLPFTGKDALEIIHSHIAKEPVPPHQLKPELPEAISNIVLKLMAKNAEDRYQSAAGLVVDLKHCQYLWQTEGKIVPFGLGKEDFSNFLQIPQTLYGRREEIQQLLTAFERVTSGGVECLLVTGYSGVGKSSLIHEVHKPITAARGIFIEGKFDQLERNTPYSAWVQALTGFVNFILTFEESKLEKWKAKILNAVGDKGKILTSVLPNLEEVIGKQPEVTPLTGQEALNRFNFVFQKFIRCTAGKDHPLVIFLDDLQWMDAASLNLMEILLTDPELSHVLFIVAYWDNEVDSGHPLTATITKLHKEQVNIKQLMINNLREEDINDLLADTLNCSSLDAHTLSRIVYTKTTGNAFFIHELLHNLEEENHLTFDVKSHSWQWDTDRLETVDITDNVVELIAKKIRKFPTTVLDPLKLAACIGNDINLPFLSILTDQPEKVINQVLEYAIKENLVTRQKERFKFSHDRIQQAFYLLNAEKELLRSHLHIARFLLERNPESENDFFGIADHLSRCVSLITNTEETYKFLEICSISGEKAAKSAAYQSSLKYYLLGIELLPENHWQDVYEVSLHLFLGAAEAALLVGQFDQMEQLCKIITLESQTEMDQVKVYQLLVSGYLAQTKLKEAVEVGFKALTVLGTTFPETVCDTDWHEWTNHLDRCLGNRSIGSLMELQTMVDETAMMKLQILSRLLPAIYKFCPDYLPLITAEMVIVSIENGNIPLSTFGYGCYGLILVAFLHDYDKAWEYALVSQKLIHKYDAKSVIPRTYQVIEATIRHWKEHASGTIAPLELGYHCGMETGDLEYAAYCAEFEANHRFLLGEPLKELRTRMDAYAGVIEKTGQIVALNHHRPVQQTVHNLLAEVVDPLHLVGSAFDERRELSVLKQYNDRLCLQIVYLQKVMVSLLFRQERRAGEMAAEGAEYVDGAPGCMVLPFFLAYEILAFISAMRQDPEFGKGNIRDSLIPSFLKQLQDAARQAPMNYQHLLDLVTAEQAALDGRTIEAEALYESAIRFAGDGHYLREEALAYELASEFYHKRNMLRFAELYIKHAHACYCRWQAWAKVKELQERYPQWLFNKTKVHRATTDQTHLDLNTVIKTTQAIASEIVLNRLLTRMMHIVIENAGAQKGFLLLNKEDEWVIEAEGDIDKSEAKVLQSVNVETSGTVSAGIIHYVARTQEPVVLDDASKEGGFASDPVIQRRQSKSIVCIPLINQGNVSGILYLENNLVTGVFTPDRLAVLEMIAGQAAISLENAVLFASIQKEIGERKRAEFERAEFFNRSIDMLCIAGFDGHFTQLNAAWNSTLGWSIDEMLSRPWLSFVHPDDQQSTIERGEQLQCGKPVVQFENRYQCNDGTYRWISWNAFSMPEEEQIFAVARDVTERKLAEKEFKKHRDHLEELVKTRTFEAETAQKNFRFALQAAQAGTWFLDLIKNENRWDDRACEIYGIAKEDFDPTYEGWRKLVHPEDIEQAEHVFSESLNKGELFSNVHRTIKSNGEIVYVLAQAYVNRDAAATPIEALGVVFDVTEKILKERELQYAKETAEKANQAKSMFLANMSHELRTPLNSILGFTQLLQRTPNLSKEESENLTIINRSGEHLLTLINDVLEVAKIEAGKITVNSTTFNLLKLINDIERMFRIRTDAKDLLFTVEVAKPVTEYVKCDVGKLRQILINLLGNAVKFTERGGITLRVRSAAKSTEKSSSTSESVHLFFEVKDTGIGIAKNEMEFVFQEFEQTTSGRSTGSGTGLGMPITKTYINLLGGDISVESELGIGTIFRFTIDVRVASESELSEKKASRRVRRLQKDDEKKYRILIADDVVENRQLLTQLLESVGFLTRTTVNGKEALTQFHHWHPHLILMDCKMPEMDGLEAIRAIRAIPEGEKLPILSISASVFGNNEQEALDAGANDFLGKPVQEHELFASIKKWLPIGYIYDEDKTAVPTTRPVELSKESLKHLPKPLIEQLRQSIEIGDYHTFTHVLDGTDGNENPTIQALRSLADEYEHEKLLNLLS